MMYSALYQYHTSEPEPLTSRLAAKHAGQLLAEHIDLDKEFTGDIGGWRIIIAKIHKHREMVAEDIGLEAANGDV